MRLLPTIYFLLPLMVLFSCKKDKDESPTVSAQSSTIALKLNVNEEQERLGNDGSVSEIPSGHAAQNPDMKKLSLHYVELLSDPFTPVGGGVVLYQGAETVAGGETAIDFQEASIRAPQEVFAQIPFDQIPVGTYNDIRVSLSYQEMEIDFLFSGIEYSGSLASFLGFNQYITDVNVEGQTTAVNENKLQGFWIFETLGQTFTGQAPEGATTVVNPLFASSPIPAGSCLVTGALAQPLTIDGDEQGVLDLVLSFSTNQSFEWLEVNEDGKYEPNAGENVVDMGVRGLEASWSWQ